MPVTPAPTTSTSTGSAVVIGTSARIGRTGGALIGYCTDRSTIQIDREERCRDGPVRTRAPGPRAQAALLRRRLLRARGRAALAPRLADGVPPRRDPRCVRL